MPKTQTNNLEKALFAMGCFWKPDLLFSKITGVVKVTVGYTGGHTENPLYSQVCSGRTGHAEAVLVLFDPSKISYDDLLKIFWENHNPTTLNRQGPDVGEQYRSAIFFHDSMQEEKAGKSKEALEASRKYTKPIVTEIVRAGEFYPGEEYHQKYLEKRGLDHCSI